MQPQPFLQQQSSPRHEEAPFWARNLQGNVFHLFYLSFLAGLEDLLLRLTTSLFMDFNQVCQAATTTTICLSLDLAPKISLTCAVVLEFQRLAGKYVWSSCENWQDRYHYDSHYLVWIFRYIQVWFIWNAKISYGINKDSKTAFIESSAPIVSELYLT